LIFAHSSLDVLLVGLCLAELSLKLLVLAGFAVLGTPWLWLAGCLAVYLNCTNYQCVAHNFLHNPFFCSKSLNRLFPIVNSLALGISQCLYRVYHLNHHRFGSDRPNPVTGDTRDHSSIYRHSRLSGRAEPFWKYAIFGPLRIELRPLYRQVRRYHLAPAIWSEIVSIAVFWAFLIVWRPYAFLLWFVPVWYLGQVGAYAENYLEHYAARPGSRSTDSVSCYNRIYNWLRFNSGFHQEHHYRPRVHWTRVPALRRQMLPDSQRRVVVGAHWFNSGKPTTAER
jgi:fatty acid desaturase